MAGQQIRQDFFYFFGEARYILREVHEEGVEEVNRSKQDDSLDNLIGGVEELMWGKVDLSGELGKVLALCG